MHRFFKYFLMAFGALLFWQIMIRLPHEQRYQQRVERDQIQGRVLQVAAPDLFAEKNIYDTFAGRYGASLKIRFVNSPAAILDVPAMTEPVVVVPSFAFAAVRAASKLTAVQAVEAPNLANLLDSYREMALGKYGCGGGTCGVPVAWVPWALFVDRERVNPTTSGRPYFTDTRGWKIGLADDPGSALALARILGVADDAAALAALLPRKDLRWFDADDPADVERLMGQEKPAVILGPSHLKGLIAREGSKHEMFLPDEGTYATLYLLSVAEGPDRDLGIVFLNHLTDPTIHKNLATVMTAAIPNRLALATVQPVLTSALRLNDAAYAEKLLVLEDAAAYRRAQAFHAQLRAATVVTER